MLGQLLLQLLHKVDSHKARVVRKKKRSWRYLGMGSRSKYTYWWKKKKKSPTGLGLGIDSSYSPYYAWDAGSCLSSTVQGWPRLFLYCCLIKRWQRSVNGYTAARVRRTMRNKCLLYIRPLARCSHHLLTLIYFFHLGRGCSQDLEFSQLHLELSQWRASCGRAASISKYHNEVNGKSSTNRLTYVFIERCPSTVYRTPYLIVFCRD